MVLAGHVGAEHVVENHILEVLLTGSLHRSHPLQLPDVVLQVLDLVLVFLLLQRDVQLQLSQTSLRLILLLSQFLNFDILPCNFLKKA